MVIPMNIRTYSELITLPTFEERYKYLRLGGKIGEITFGFDKYLYENFLRSDEWIELRDFVIIRDGGCDLAMPDREIFGWKDRLTKKVSNRIIVHHMNPVRKEDILRRTKFLLDPEYLVCTIKNTHDAIHYGDESLLIKAPVERTPNDTCPWKRL